MSVFCTAEGREGRRRRGRSVLTFSSFKVFLLLLLASSAAAAAAAAAMSEKCMWNWSECNHKKNVDVVLCEILPLPDVG